MPEIKVLPPDLVDQIAAGEVVTRPASAIRELLDNAIDAGASNILVEIEKGGKKKIAVRDDGIGLDAKSLRLAVTSHATSKIRDIDDLHNVRTLGFRGEALASILSVSRVEILSSPLEGEARRGGEGSRLVGAGGKISSVSPAASPPGTTVSIRDLFWNVPARRKFLRSDAAETRAVTEAIVEKALARPQVSFRYVRDGNEAFNLSAGSTLKDRVREIFGRDVSEACIPFDRSTSTMRVSGLAGDPSVAKSTRSHIYLFVNGRRIQEPRLSHAVLTVYREVLDQGFPAVFCFIEIDPHLVDVNVHPAKAEIRFSDSSVVYSFVAETIAAAVHAPQQIAGKVPQVAVAAQDTEFSASVMASALSPSLLDSSPLPSVDRPAEDWARDGEEAAASADGMPARPNDHGGSGAVSRFKIFGQIYKTFLLAEEVSTGEFWLIDQHVASERVLLSRMTARIEARAPLSQGLLVPLVLELGLKDAICFDRVAAALRRMGFETEPFGPRGVWIVRAVPAILGRRVADRKIFLKFVEELSSFDTTRRSEEELFHDVLAHFSCRSAIKAGDMLLPEEQAQLLSDLLSAEHFRICPHGRPSMIKISQEELERRFLRK